MNVSHTTWEPEGLNAGRLAAIAFVIGVTAAIYGNFVLRGPLFVSTDMAETIRRTEGGLRLLRTSVVLDSAYALAMLLTAAALHALLSPVRRLPALNALLCQAVHALTAVLATSRSRTISAVSATPATFYSTMCLPSICCPRPSSISRACICISSTSSTTPPRAADRNIQSGAGLQVRKAMGDAGHATPPS